MMLLEILNVILRGYDRTALFFMSEEILTRSIA